MDKKLLTPTYISWSNFRSFHDKNHLIKEKNFKKLDKYKLNYNSLQSRAIKLYTDDVRSVINSYFREKKPFFTYKIISGIKISYNQFILFCNELNKITKRNSLLENTILYRGLKSSDYVSNSIENGFFCERGFCSTTFDKDIAIEKANVIDENGEIIDFGWLMEIYAPKGTIGGFIAEHSVKPIEMEFLLPRNRNLDIFDINYENKILKVFDKNIYNIINK